MNAPDMSGFDQDDVRRERERYEVQLWDGTGELLGRSAEEWAEAREDFRAVFEDETHQAYVIRRDGAPFMLQPHAPNVGGLEPMTDVNGDGKLDVLDVAEAHVLELVAETLRNEAQRARVESGEASTDADTRVAALEAELAAEREARAKLEERLDALEQRGGR